LINFLKRVSSLLEPTIFIAKFVGESK
jgi:hypothetical protein